MSINLVSILPLVQVILSAVGPQVKAAALAELKALAVKDAANPILVLVIDEVEKMVQAA